MEKTGLISRLIGSDIKMNLKNVTSLTLSNYGSDPLTVIVNDVPRTVPALREEIGVPMGSYNLPGDGTACKLTLEVKFTGESKHAILDYRVYNPQEC
ncbi:hypothetical protein FUA48_08450 [Flavobacterium alkalisoli]|uniref:Uncharacterized protein n=1 Tax=Flavobacterium alkalisoli TaxID=2602769 RepID=A0A5B9FRJ4_9FLAO|nr:hypothetical protein [Flavobacterium alkalisoli]QEE49610.1 hypothetical protein FUA48_08450 [Flavobacterium alkalisoli]